MRPWSHNLLIGAAIASASACGTTERGTTFDVEEELESCDGFTSPLTPDCRRVLAWYYAPVIYQNTDDDRRDFLAAFDFDGDWDPTNQKVNVQNPQYPLTAHVYFAVVEGKTHFFIGYGLYHPVDYKSVGGHESDFEGIVLVVERTESGPGKLKVMETLAHNQFYQYYNDYRIGDQGRHPGLCYENLDRAIPISIESEGNRLLAERPQIVVEAKGHGIYAYGHRERVGATTVEYVPAPLGAPGEEPASRNASNVPYRLVDLAGHDIWEKRQDVAIFKTHFPHWTGKRHQEESSGQLLQGIRDDGNANPPWAWNDIDDCDVRRGDWYLAPAYSAAQHLRIPGLDEATVNDPEYYLNSPFFDGGVGGNPRFSKAHLVNSEQTAAASSGPLRENGETIYRYGGRELIEWIPGQPTSESHALPELSRDTRGSFVRVRAPGEESANGTLGVLRLSDMWIALGEDNSVALRYDNPFGVPAARIRYRTSLGTRDDARPHVSGAALLLLPSLTAAGGPSAEVDVEPGLRVDTAKESFLRLPRDEEKPFLTELVIEFTEDLREWGAEGTRLNGRVPDRLPANIQRQLDVFDRTSQSDLRIDVFAIDILTDREPG